MVFLLAYQQNYINKNIKKLLDAFEKSLIKKNCYYWITGFLGSYFYKKFKKKYKIFKYPHRIENIKNLKIGYQIINFNILFILQEYPEVKLLY